MSTRPGYRRSGGAATSGLLTLLGLLLLATACVPPLPGSTTPYVEYTTGQGVDRNTGSLKIRNLIVVCDNTGACTLVGTILNDSAMIDAVDDALTGVETEAGSGELKPNRVPLRTGSTATLGVGTTLDTTAAQVTLRGDAIRPGRMVRVTLTFAEAEPITAPVLVVSKTGRYSNVPVPG